MKREDLISKVNEALAEEFEVELSVIAPDDNIKETLELDSLGLVDMVALLENLFSIKIKGPEIVEVKTFDNLYSFIEKKISE
ncbi:phosphopantetheine-binding protein [Bacteroidales bacterium OttesenSCG-928-C19]|nr:phosphopantetheine-binding protein [Bacteroidales bacterium OttesenSCG-928-C19]